MADKYFYAAGGTGSWITPRGNPAQYGSWYAGPGGTGGLVNYPTNGDTAIFNAASGGGTCIVGQSVSCTTLITTGFTGAITGQGVNISVYGTSITLGESEVFAANRYPGLIINSGTTTTLTSNGQTVGDVNVVSGSTLVIADNLTSVANSIFTVSGTFNSNNKDVSVGQVNNAGSIIMGSGKWTLGGAGPPNNPFTVWTVTGTPSLNITSAQPIRLLRYVAASRIRASLGIDNSTNSIQIYGAMLQNYTTTTWPTSGTVLIDDELITYTGYTATSVMDVTLTGCTRGINSTTAASHSKYANVLLISPQPITILTSNLSATDTTSAYVTNNSVFDGASGSVLIDGEVIQYGAKNSSTTLDGLTRGSSYGTTGGVSHLSGAIVRAVEARIFNAPGVSSYPPIESWSNGNYQFTDFQGNGANSAGGINNITTNNLGPQKLSFASDANGTYYSYMSGGENEEFFSLF